MRVLVVDDDALIAMGTAAMLEELGHEAFEALSGVAALAILAATPDLDAVITDHAMPGMTGADLAARIAAARPGLPVVLASGYSDLPTPASGPLRRLPKPFTEAQLARVLADLPGRPADAPAPVAPG